MNTLIKNMTLKKIFFKLMNNSVFGKIVENVRKHRISSLYNQKKKEFIWCHNQRFIQKKLFSENLLAIE